MRNFGLFLGIAALSIFPLVASASTPDTSQADPSQEPYKQCADISKECFVKSDIEKANCLFTASKHAFCEGTALGKIIFKRWAVAPVRPMGLEAPPAFLGPRLIDQKCVENFDNRLMGSLIKAEQLTAEALGQMESDLGECTKEVSDQLTRP